MESPFVEKHSLNGWHNLLVQKHEREDLTFSEAQLLVLLDIRNNVILTAQKTTGMLDSFEHVEGMIGAIDNFAEGLARRSGVPYASSAKVREALDATRDELRKLTASTRQEILHQLVGGPDGRV